MKHKFLVFLFFFIFVNTKVVSENIYKGKDTLIGQKNFFHDFKAINDDNTINVIVEIPAGENQKWEVSTIDGYLKWEYSNNSYRTVKYLPYIVNYGFVPQTLYSKDLGGDGDPVDVILLGEKKNRGAVIKAKIIGLIKMIDSGKADHKIIALPIDSQIFLTNSLSNIEDLKKNYPGMLKIIEIWFENYKHTGQVIIQGYDNTLKALDIIKSSQKPYEVLRGYWMEKN